MACLEAFGLSKPQGNWQGHTAGGGKAVSPAGLEAQELVPKEAGPAPGFPNSTAAESELELLSAVYARSSGLPEQGRPVAKLDSLRLVRHEREASNEGEQGVLTPRSLGTSEGLPKRGVR